MSAKPAKKTATKKAEVLRICRVVAPVQIGAMKCLPGTIAWLPESKAKALEADGKAIIEGIA